MALWYNILVLSIMITTQAYGSGVFELDLHEFKNDYSLLSNDSPCGPDCRTFFRVCLKIYQTQVTSGDCVFGSNITPVLGSKSFSVMKNDGVNKPIRLPVDYRWPGAFSLIVEAWYAPTQELPLDTSNPELLISFFATQRKLEVGAEWSRDFLTWKQTELRYSYRFICNENYYGDSCSQKCTPRDDRFGHYTCDPDGKISCLPGWNGMYCEEPICLEGCSKTNGNCSKPGESAGEGWQGVFCEECKRHPACKHGTCQQPWQCTCDEGWGGILCDQDLNYCTHHKPCRNGTCMNTGQGSYTCTCHPGFTGVKCEREVKECDRRPCLNGGVCQDLESGYSCQCPQGYEGAHCETRVLTCADSPCFQVGRCHDKDDGRSYVCECPAGFTGLNCEKRVDKCTALRCANGGQCVLDGNVRKCSCRSGFIGLRCEININDCANNPCANGSTCKDSINGYTCMCLPGFQGRNCDRPTDICTSRPCQNGGTCRKGTGCVCPPLFSGPQCEQYTPVTTTPTPGDHTPWAAVLLAVGLVAMTVLLCMVVFVLRFVHKQKAGEHLDSATKNNLSDFQKDNLISAMQLKNNNKKADLEVDCPSEKLNYKHINYHKDYKSPMDYKEELSREDKLHHSEKCLEEKKPLGRIYREKPECRISTICSSRDSMYQSVFVITEERNECVIATEV